ncbi:uncharacterized protein LOC127128413 isoform X1 [Lathyrus oleraceus]|nr:uncharacterized protein LOC127128413 isoform X1 [Pisum sativum]KAI5431799.1 hypothetical protein KIW84_035820 [Pisum sativum]
MAGTRDHILFLINLLGQVLAKVLMKVIFLLMELVLAMTYTLSFAGIFKEHPQLVKNDFYITGESNARHYIPALASRVHKGDKNKEGIIINFKVLQYPNVAFDSDSFPNERS